MASSCRTANLGTKSGRHLRATQQSWPTRCTQEARLQRSRPASVGVLPEHAGGALGGREQRPQVRPGSDPSLAKRTRPPKRPFTAHDHWQGRASRRRLADLAPGTLWALRPGPAAQVDNVDGRARDKQRHRRTLGEPDHESPGPPALKSGTSATHGKASSARRAPGGPGIDHEDGPVLAAMPAAANTSALGVWVLPDDDDVAHREKRRVTASPTQPPSTATTRQERAGSRRRRRPSARRASAHRA